MVDDQAEHWRRPFFSRQRGAEPLFADAFIGRCCAGQGEGGVCEGGVFDAGAPGHVVADVVWVLVGEDGGERDGCWGWGERVARGDCEAFCFGAVGVTVRWKVV